MAETYGQIKEVDIERASDDTDDIIITVKNNGVAVDVLGWTADITVNPEKSPTVATNNVFESNGAAISPTTNGQISIDMSSFSVTAGNYFYDIRIIDAALKGRTSIAGKFKVIQRIPKS